MTLKSSVLTYLLIFSVLICFGQTTTKKTYTKAQLAEFEANYKIKKKKDKAARKDLNNTILTELSLQDITGTTHTLESLKGKVVVMNFWFINCKPCVAEIPDLNELKSKFKEQPVVFFAVALDNKSALEKFLEHTRFDFTIIPRGGSLAKRFKIPHYPYNVILDQNGQLEYVSDVLSLNIMNRLKRRINGLLKRN